MKIPIVRALALVTAVLPLGVTQAWSGSGQPASTCSELLDQGERMTGSSDKDVRLLGLQQLREAELTCSSPQLSPSLRARALMLTTRLYAGDPVRQREIWSSALNLIRTEDPDSPLLPRAMEGLAGVLSALGAYDDALSLMTDALDERQRLFGEESREYVRGLTLVASTYQPLADIRDRDANLRTAQDYAERALATARRLFGIRDGTSVTAAAVLIEVLERRGLQSEADHLQEEIRPYVDLMDTENPASPDY